MAHVKITQAENSTRTKIEIDGMDVSGSCKGAMFSAYVGEPPELHLDLLLRGTTVEGEARIRIDPHTAVILQAAGWRPPGPQGPISMPFPDAPRLPDGPREVVVPLRTDVPPS